MRDLRRFAGPLFLLLILGLPLASGCDSNTDEGPQETVITRFVLTLVKADGSGGTVEVDVPLQNGTAPNPPTLQIDDGSSYDASVRVFGRTGGGAETEITQDIRQEGERYQVFFNVLGDIANVVRVQVLDEDDLGFPLGMSLLIDTADGASGDGTLRVRLAHFQTGQKTGVSVGEDLRFEARIPLRLFIP